MLILGIDTSTAFGSVALFAETGLVGSLTVSVDLTHSEGLMPAVDSLLQRANRCVDDLTAIACVSGPGSYTGLRVGIATAQGIAYAHHLPCASFTSLEILACSLPYVNFQICPLLPARKGWVYARIFRCQGHEPQALTEELNLRPDDLIQRISEPTILYGPGLSPYRSFFQEVLQDQFIPVPEVFDAPRADLLAELAARDLSAGKSLSPSALLPHYLGPSQAEVNWKRLQSTPTSK